jgi:hypothetical protein
MTTLSEHGSATSASLLLQILVSNVRKVSNMILVIFMCCLLVNMKNSGVMSESMHDKCLMCIRLASNLDFLLNYSLSNG